MQPELKEFIRNEITKQLQQLKKTIDEEIAQDIKQLRADLTAQIDQKYNNTRTDINRQNEAIKKIANDKALTKIPQRSVSQEITKEETTKLISVAVQQASNVVYKEVMNEINTKIVPKVDQMVRYVNYQMQDGQSLVTDYRRAVHRQEKSETAGLLTNGGDTKHILSENVELFFHADD